MSPDQSAQNIAAAEEELRAQQRHTQLTQAERRPAQEPPASAGPAGRQEGSDQ